jgi:hypothetical protein
MSGIDRGPCEAHGTSDDCIMSRWLETLGKSSNIPRIWLGKYLPFREEWGAEVGPLAEKITLSLLVMARGHPVCNDSSKIVFP